MANQKVTVPDIGDFDSVPVIEVLVADGDTVEAEQPLVVLESDKATMEIPSPGAGKVSGLKVKEGDKVSEGDLLCELQAEDADSDAEAEDEKAAAPDADSEDPPPKDHGADDESKSTSKAESESDDSEDEEDSGSSEDESESDKAQAGKTVSVAVPDIGDYDDVPVIEVLVSEGDTVEEDQALIVLESDKATMDVPAPQAGTVRNLKVKEGDKLSKGDAVCELETDDGGDTASSETQEKRSKGDSKAAKKSDTASKAEQKTSEAEDEQDRQAEKLAEQDIKAEEKEAAAPEPPALERGELPIHASPSVRKFSRKLGVNLRDVKGSGPNGRILKEDVEGYVTQALQGGGAGAASTSGAGLPAQPKVDFSKFGPVEEKPLARIRKISAQHLHKNWLLVPHVTQTDNADITELEAFRKQANGEGRGPKLTLLPFVIKAVAQALKTYPEFNSSLSADGEKLLMKGYCHIGFAADTPNGLVVPVIRDVWSKGIAELAEESAALAEKARDGKLKPDEMKGGCFSISSLGGIGGSHFTPIVNAPEVGILGVSRASMQPVWDGSAFQPRLMCPLSLSYDHRVIDGAYAARFTVELVRLLSDIRRLSL